MLPAVWESSEKFTKVVGFCQNMTVWFLGLDLLLFTFDEEIEHSSKAVGIPITVIIWASTHSATANGAICVGAHAPYRHRTLHTPLPTQSHPCRGVCARRKRHGSILFRLGHFFSVFRALHLSSTFFNGHLTRSHARCGRHHCRTFLWSEVGTGSA